MSAYPPPPPGCAITLQRLRRLERHLRASEQGLGGGGGHRRRTRARQESGRVVRAGSARWNRGYSARPCSPQHRLSSSSCAQPAPAPAPAPQSPPSPVSHRTDTSHHTAHPSPMPWQAAGRPQRLWFRDHSRTWRRAVCGGHRCDGPPQSGREGGQAGRGGGDRHGRGVGEEGGRAGRGAPV